MGKHWRSRDTSETKLVRSSFSKITMGDTVRASFIRPRMGESTELGMYVRSSKTKWLERSRIWFPCGRNWWKMWILTNPHHFLTGMGKTSREISGVVLRHGRTCSKMQWAILRIGKQECGATLHSFKSLPGWSSIQAGGARISWRIVRSSLTNCLEMLVFGTNLKTRHSMVCQQICKGSHKMDSGLRQTIGNIDFKHSSHKWLLRYCFMGNTAQQCRLGLFQDSDFAGDLEVSKSTSGGALCIFGSRTFVPVSWMCKKQTSVSHSSTEPEIISLDAGLIVDGLLALDLWVFVIEVPRSTNNTVQPKHNGMQEIGGTLHSKTKTPNVKRR